MTERDLRREVETPPPRFPRPWRPQPGDVIEGMLVEYRDGFGVYDEARIAIVRIDETPGIDGLVAVWIFHAALRDLFYRLRPRPGERLALKRLSDTEGGFARYHLVLNRPESPPEVPEDFTRRRSLHAERRALKGRQAPVVRPGQ